jgi:outer membrane protein assembly factor BamB
VLLLALVAAPAAGARDWLRFGGDDQLTNDVAAADAAGISSATAPHLGVRWRAALDGAVIASPLSATVTVAGSPEQLVFAATNGGSVYALRANDGTVLWQRQLGTVSVPACGETFGISSTGVIDPATNRLYVIGASGLLYALDLATGATAPGWPLQIVSNTGAEYVWGGLTSANGMVYVPIASYCDEPDPDGTFATGRLVAVDPGGPAIAATWVVSPDTNELGSIWGFGGTSVDPTTGALWTATGNSWSYDPDCDCINETAGYGETVAELNPALDLLAWNRPPGIPDGDDDTDFGSTPLLVQPPGCPPLAAANSKNGTTYVWNRDDLADGPIWSAQIGPEALAAPFIGQPSYSPATNMLYVTEAQVDGDDALAAFAIGPDCTIETTPTWTAPAGSGTTPPALVVGDVVFVAGGDGGTLTAVDAQSGATLFSTGLDGLAYAPPAFAGGQVLVGTAAGSLYAFAPPAPTIQGARDRTVTAPKRTKSIRVTYAVSARDSADAQVLLVCTPPSGSAFRVGRTKVTCATADATATATFTVTVRAPS